MNATARRAVRALPFLAASLLAAAALAGCCMGGGGTTTSAPPIPMPSVAPAVAPAAVPGVAASVITLAPGFADNIIYTMAGGPLDASTIATPDVYCAGHIAAVPNVTLTTTAPIAGLRILARASEDSTLAVRLSDGRVFCDDDGGGYPNPALTMDVPAGVHMVYVGSFHDGDTPAATVAFTTNPGLTNAALP